MKLAWKNLVHDPMRFLVTVIGVAFAMVLMVFQSSLLVGFSHASSVVIDATDVDIWITGYGVQCLEFATPLPKKFAELAAGVRGVGATYRLVVGHTQWQGEAGERVNVMLIGAEPGLGRSFPFPYLNVAKATQQPAAIVVDQSSGGLLKIKAVPQEIELSQRRAHVTGLVNGFNTFLADPYAFTGYDDAVDFLRIPAEETKFVLVRVAPGYDPQQVLAGLRAKFPEASVWTRADFSQMSRRFWVVKTGAGPAILVLALFGFVIGLVVVSQNIYATTMENIEEYATLKAIGASPGFIRKLVTTQAIICGLIGSAVGLLLTFPAAHAAQTFIPWIHTPAWLPIAMTAVSLLMCVLASITSIRKAVSIEPGRVFRA